MDKRKRKVIYAISILVGTIVGAGYLSLPYVASKVGFGIMLLYFLILGAVALVIHLVFTDVALETKDYLRFPGYAKIYFGRKGEMFALFLTVFSIIGTLLAYAIVGGELLAGLFSSFGEKSAFFYTLFYFAIASVLIYFGIKIVSRVQFLAMILFLFVIVVMIFASWDIISFEKAFLPLQLPYLFLPYGALLFAFCGLNLIPEAEEILKKDKKLLKKLVIPFSIFISLLLYVVFTFLVLGICGKETTDVAVPCLNSFLSKNVVALVIFFVITTTFTSFLTLGLTLKKTLLYDFKIKKKISWALTCFVPLILFLLGVRSFIDIIIFIGAVMLGLQSIMIVLMYQKLKKPSQLKKKLVLFFIFLFVLGIIYQVVFFLKF